MYAPSNVCIYCGAADVALSREHIIPYALGGNDVIPRASCAVHAAITSAFERDVARDIYGVHRAHEGTQSRRKSHHAATLKSNATVNGVDLNGNEVVAQIPLNKLPRLPTIIEMQAPGIWRGAAEEVNDGATIHTLPSDQDSAFALLRQRLNWNEVRVSTPSVRPRSFSRLLAKIAHAYACAELGVDGFLPVLIPLIVGEPVSETFYVGGFEPQRAQDKDALKLELVSQGDESLISVSISLHFFPDLPRYQVVCGARPPAA